MQLKMTFYGAPDNDPPCSRAIAYSRSWDNRTLHHEAGGTGTYEDPLTVAVVTRAQGGQWDPGTRMYVPSLRKYLIVEDECATCSHDQIDVWMESNCECPSAVVLRCEETWTPDTPIEVDIDPPPGRPVDTSPFFDVISCHCRR